RGRSGLLDDELDEHHRCRVAAPGSELGDTRVSPVDILVPRSHHVEQALDGRLMVEPRHHQVAVVAAVLAGDGNKLLHHTAQLLGLRLGGGQSLILDKGNRELSEHRLALAWVPTELASRLLVPHSSCSSSSGSTPSSVPPSDAIASAASRVSGSSSTSSSEISSSPLGTRPASWSAARSSLSDRGPKFRMESSSSGSMESTWPTFSIC